MSAPLPEHPHPRPTRASLLADTRALVAPTLAVVHEDRTLLDAVCATLDELGTLSEAMVMQRAALFEGRLRAIVRALPVRGRA